MKKGFVKEINAILQYIKPYRKESIFGIIALLFSSSSVLMLSQSVRRVIDQGIAVRNDEMLLDTVLQTFAIVLILGIATALRFFYVTYIGEKVVTDIRRKIGEKILSLSPSFFEINKAGDLLTQLSGDTTTIYNIISSNLSVMMRNIVMLVGAFILMLSTSIKLTAIITLIIPVLVILVVIMSRTTRKLSRQSQDKVAELTSLTDEIIHNIKTIQAYTQESNEKQKFEQKLLESVHISLNRIFSRAILTFALIVSVFSTVGIILWIGSTDVIKNNISSGSLSSFIFLTILCSASMIALSETINNIQKAAGVSERIQEFLLTEVSIKNCENSIKVQNIKDFSSKNIVFKNVTFAYPAKINLPVFKNLSICFKAGETTALVGESGAGKSTIFQLLLRFYDVTDGSILYCDTDISKIELESLRNEFAYVSQDASIFSASIYDNIVFSNPMASKEMVFAAAEAAAALEFIEKLPNGFDTFVGEKGVRLSGGQKQRIAIARAILKNPKILLLDEATSSLDTQNEILVQQGLFNLMKNRTCIVIAHRLSTIKNANNIIVIKDGEVIEQGKHEELLAQNKYYTKLYESGSVL